MSRTNELGCVSMSSVYALYDIAMSRNAKTTEKPKAPKQNPEKKPTKQTGYTIVVPTSSDTQNKSSEYCSITSSDR